MVAVEKQLEDTARVEAVEVRRIPHRTRSARLHSIHLTLELMVFQDTPSSRIEAETFVPSEEEVRQPATKALFDMIVNPTV